MSVMQRNGYNIEVIVTGDEVLFGRIQDTNSNWLARRVAELGAHLKRVTVIGDEVDEIGGVLRDALTRGNDMIVFTGGLGPSEDDLTVEAIARVVGSDVVHDQGAIERIRLSYEARGIEYTARGERMARIAEGARAIPNPVGLAAGMMLQEGGTLIVTFPGIPVEMVAMFDGFVAPIIEEGAPTKFVARTLTARVKFLEFFPIYRQMHVDYPDVYIKNAATPPESREGRSSVREIKVDIVAEGGTRELSEARMEEVVSDFRSRIEAQGGLLLEDSS